MALSAGGGLRPQPYGYVSQDPANRMDPTGLFEGNLTSQNAKLGVQSTLQTGTVVGLRTVARPLSTFAVRMILAGVGVSIGVGLYTLAKTDEKAATELQLARDTRRKVIEDEEERRKSKILYHYTSMSEALEIAADRVIYASAKKRFGGYTFPSGAYATDVAPWNLFYTQRQLSALFYGGSEHRDVSWFVAIEESDFYPLSYPEFPNQYCRPAPEGFPVPVEVVLVGPNLMDK